MAPAEETMLVAMVHGRCHLHTPVALDAIELLLVADPTMEQGLPEPMAELDPAMASGQPVAPLPEDVSYGIIKAHGRLMRETG